MLRSTIALANFPAVDVEVRNGRAYVVGDGLQIVDVRDPASSVLHGSIALPQCDYANGVAVTGGTAYVTGGSSNQLYVVDVRNPAQPTLHASRMIPGFPSNIRAANTFIVVAAEKGGLQIFRTQSGPQQIYLPMITR